MGWDDKIHLDKSGNFNDELETPIWYRIEGTIETKDGPQKEYGYIKYDSEEGIIGTEDNGQDYEDGQEFSIVFLHSANGLLATPEFGTHIIKTDGKNLLLNQYQDQLDLLKIQVNQFLV